MSTQTSSVPSPILGTISEVCIVSSDIKKSIDGLTSLGVGPFQLFHFNSTTVHEREYRGQAGDFELLVAFAKQGSLVFELMQPISGQSLMSDYLERSGGKEGVQHVAFDMGDIPMVKRQEIMKARGFEIAMEGVWKGAKGDCHFCFFDTESRTGTVFETIVFSEDWKDPECEWYPCRPSDEVKVK